MYVIVALEFLAGSVAGRVGPVRLFRSRRSVVGWLSFGPGSIWRDNRIRHSTKHGGSEQLRNLGAVAGIGNRKRTADIASRLWTSGLTE